MTQATRNIVQKMHERLDSLEHRLITLESKSFQEQLEEDDQDEQPAQPVADDLVSVPRNDLKAIKSQARELFRSIVELHGRTVPLRLDTNKNQ